MTRRAVLLLLAAFPAGCAAVAAPADLHFGTAKLVIVTATGRYPFRVEVARTSAQLERGLMFRKHLAADAGMVFVYPEPAMVE
ncbi:MAG TPA: DUF192 domain-containing protein, partial [Stellaceae bacterium]|nr:DUF192 domain-containing protein [Stellaceae bacterium]